MDGEYALIDVEAEAHDLPFASNSQDYIISSHVFEHLPNPIQAMVEWRRVLKNGGIVFMIVPLRNALPDDRARALSTFDEVWAAYEAKVTVDTWDYNAKPVPGGRRGHYFVYTPELVKQLVEAVDGDWWELVAEEAVDTKVGNGFTLAFKLDKPEKGDPRLYVADDEQERFDTKHDAEVVADGGEVAKIGEEDEQPLKLFSLEDLAVTFAKPEDGTIHTEDFAQGGYVTDATPALLHSDTVVSREQFESFTKDHPIVEGLDVLNPGLNALGGLATPGVVTGTVTGNRKPAAKKRTPKKKS